MSCKVNIKSTKPDCLGFRKKINFRIGFYQKKNYRSYYVTTAKNLSRKKSKYLLLMYMNCISHSAGYQN